MIVHGDAFTLLEECGSVDCVITDPPYSRRTHTGHEDGIRGLSGAERSSLVYAHFTEDDCIRLARLLNSVCRGWIVWMTDHVLFPVISDEFASLGRYVFAPVPFTRSDRNVRFSGDGPASSTVYIFVCRPKSAPYSRWGSLPGYYSWESSWGKERMIGGKPLGLVSRLVRDYSKEGDLVLDPFAGAGTTAVAALLNKRGFLTYEKDEERFALASEQVRLAQVKLSSSLF